MKQQGKQKVNSLLSKIVLKFKHGTKELEMEKLHLRAKATYVLIPKGISLNTMFKKGKGNL